MAVSPISGEEDGHRQRRRAGEERHYDYLNPVCIRVNKITFGKRAGLEVRKNDLRQKRSFSNDKISPLLPSQCLQI